MSVTLVQGTQHVVRRWRREMTTGFLSACPRLAELKREAWSTEPEGDPARRLRPRGRGYAVVHWPAADLLAASKLGAEDFARCIVERLEQGAHELGVELERHLRGQGTERSYGEELEREAIAKGVAVAVEGFVPAEPGDVFVHLGGLPHVAEDDGLSVWRSGRSDGLIVVLRFFGTLFRQAVAPPA